MVLVIILPGPSALASATAPVFAFNKRPLNPASGYRNRTSGGLNNVGSNGNYWSSAVNSAANAYNLNFNSGNVNPLNNNNRANGFAVRPVRALKGLGISYTSDMQYSREDIHALVTAAYLDARQNERNKPTQLAFELNLESNLWDLSDLLYNRAWRPSPPIVFIIEYPTKREVFAPIFQDRIVSHVLYNLIAPLFEQTFIYDSYSCRKGRGTQFGIERFEHNLRAATDNWKREAYVLNMDISGYFMSINKGILYNILCRDMEKYRGRLAPSGKIWNETIDYSFTDYLICANLFRNPAENCIFIGRPSDYEGMPTNKSLRYSPLGTGLTIGDVISQLFSNIYLNPFDQFAKRQLGGRYYGRYVDDARAASPDKNFLIDSIPAADEFLRTRLALKLHPNKTTITSTRRDNYFLGADVREYRRYAVNRTVANFHKAIHELEYWATFPAAGLEDFNKALARLNSYLGYFQHFDEYKTVAATLDGSPLHGIFTFAAGYRKAALRPEIKQSLNKQLL